MSSKQHDEHLLTGKDLISEPQARVQKLLDELVDRGGEHGLQVAVYLDGKLIVDAWAGIANDLTKEPVNGDTLFTVYSAGKGLVFTVIHQLTERNMIDYDAPVSLYWPEFAANGKENITVRDVLTHRAGIPQMPAGITPEKLTDWDFMAKVVAELEPLWQPGTKTGYHAFTQGWILGELIRRVDGRTIAQLVRDEISKPLKIEDLYFGIPEEAEARVARISGKMPSGGGIQEDMLINRVIPYGIGPGNEMWNRSDIRQASIPGAGAIVSARALARHYAALSGEGVDGTRLLTPERTRIAAALQTAEPDVVMFNSPTRKGLGYWLGESLFPMINNDAVFGHTGSGGSIGFVDPVNHLALALTKNKLSWGAGNEAAEIRIIREVYQSLRIPQ
ncbi:serine hydrolase domain-containing protein [Paenibacillus medicaginis]|uniref:Serine hydrolase domain-containing protein n=1 Tax=Paenibacillus medicaginis TaxID=1470560 RepID=A0ABV5C1E3_9BACL